MTNRLGWGGDPRAMWKVWDEFGIQEARMIGYWDPACPVKTDCADVLATAYVRQGKTLVSLASWAANPVTPRLSIDCAALGLDPAKVHLYAPYVAGFQPESLFKPQDPIPVVPGRGWLLVIDHQQRQLPPAVDIEAGLKVLLEDAFAGDALSREWSVSLSNRPGTKLKVADGKLRIEAAANACAFAERTIPPGAGLVVCSIDEATDGGASWGPGMALVWPDGKALRVNLRAEGRMGVDDGRRQILDGMAAPATWTQLVFRLDDKEIRVQASWDGRVWQDLARFPRSEFPGDPLRVRLGKTSPGSKNEDFSTPGPDGACEIRRFRVLAKD
jgi:hypothetical protein